MRDAEQGQGRSKGASISTIIAVVVILTGVGLLAYPHIIGAIYGTHRASDTKSYDEAVSGLDQKKQDEDLADAQKYNEWVASRHGASIASLDPSEASGVEGGDASDSPNGSGSNSTPEDSGTDSAPDRSDNAEIAEAYERLMNPSGNGVMGQVTVDRLSLTVPLYHDDKEENMLYGAAHLRGTSLPIGGPSTHAAVWAHRGEPGASYFKDLDQVVEGDLFHITAYGKTLNYEVDKISVVEPGDRTQLDVVEGEDLFTLITCTPYGVNSHRLLVRGHRVS